MYENNTWPSVHGALSGSDGSKPAPSSKIALVLDFATIRAPVDRRVPSENDENDCNGSILLKKYPQKNCRIGNRNERIQTSRLLNQNCAVALELESMLLSIPLQIPFSTVVRPEGAQHQWREVPPRELSVDLVADERFGRATGRIEAS